MRSAIPSGRRIFLILLLVFALYAILLPIWFKVRLPYVKLVAGVADAMVFPILGVEGGVDARGGDWVSLHYFLPYHEGGMGAWRQRFLDFSDLPLAVAISMGMVFLGWRQPDRSTRPRTSGR